MCAYVFVYIYIYIYICAFLNVVSLEIAGLVHE